MLIVIYPGYVKNIWWIRTFQNSMDSGANATLVNCCCCCCSCCCDFNSFNCRCYDLNYLCCDFNSFNSMKIFCFFFFKKNLLRSIKKKRKKIRGWYFIIFFNFFMYQLHYIKNMRNSIIIHHIKKRKVSIMVSIKTQGWIEKSSSKDIKQCYVHISFL